MPSKSTLTHHLSQLNGLKYAQKFQLKDQLPQLESDISLEGYEAIILYRAAFGICPN
jgi:hypothetical protein